MRVTSPNFEHEGTIPGEFAFAVPDPDQHVALSQNRNPQLNWEDVPEGTQSFVAVSYTHLTLPTIYSV